MNMSLQTGGGLLLVLAIVFLGVYIFLTLSPIDSFKNLGTGQLLAVMGTIIIGIGLFMFSGSKTGISGSQFLGLSGSSLMIVGSVFLLLILILTTARKNGLNGLNHSIHLYF